MVQLHVALTLGALLVLLVGLVSRPLRNRSFLSEPLLALGAGVVCGPEVTGIFYTQSWPEVALLVEEVTRVTLAIGLMSIALRVPTGFLRHSWKAIVFMLAVVMPIMWVASGLIVYALVGISFWAAMLAGAIITPTDPIVASSIVTSDVAKERIPGSLRHLLSAESGFNDGLAYPFVLLGVLMLKKPPGAAIGEWALQVVLWEVGVAVLLGIGVGAVMGWLLSRARRNELVETESLLGYSLALSLLTLGLGRVIQVDGILSVFVAGVVFAALVDVEERVEQESIQEAVNLLLIMPVFFLLGIVIPWQAWSNLGLGMATLLAILVLLLRRPPVLLALGSLARPIQTMRDKAYYGWFGPIGVSALFYAALARHEVGQTRESETVWAISTFVICASVVAHGVTATFGTKMLFSHRNE